jgi:hypothetical protein
LSEHEKCSVAEMFGEFLREAAVLVLVFVPLELYKPTHSMSYIRLTIVVAFSLATFVAGVVIERIRT